MEDASIQDMRGEWFDEYNNDVNHVLWLSQSPDQQQCIMYQVLFICLSISDLFSQPYVPL